MKFEEQVARLAAARGCSLVRRLGCGGMGCVYLVRYKSTGEQRALKVMVPDAVMDVGARGLFLREIQNALSLDHPNVVRATAAGELETMLFLEMEFCSGGSADTLMKETGRVSAKLALEVICDVLMGLEYGHAVPLLDVALADGTWGQTKGFVHRDLKPQNMFLAEIGGSRTVAKVGDFGLSKAFELAGLSGATATGSISGTVAFMPRQQVLNFKYAGPEVDVWAAAASLYCMLTGATPRDFTPNSDPWQTVISTDVVPIAMRGADVPPRLARVIDDALIDRPELTFKTAGELRAALQAVRK